MVATLLKEPAALIFMVEGFKVKAARSSEV
jgi:hypothetical protein